MVRRGAKMMTIMMVMALIDNGGDDDGDKRVVKAFFVAQIVPLRWNKRNARCCVYFCNTLLRN